MTITEVGKKNMKDINYDEALMKLDFIIKEAERVRALFSYKNDSMMTIHTNHTRVMRAANSVIEDMSKIKELLESIETEA